ncbi:ferritin-like domain-containing protein [Yunchengibacter salinarum]|uniref:ferritin-like domain-containing protein n=1 Tax=Yunchengibacter salinarum TaxID=3133399 RepID=UPI0035B6878B
MTTPSAQNGAPPEQASLASAACGVLKTAPARQKAARARAVAADWAAGRLDWRFDCLPGQRPARPAHPELRAPGEMPKRRKAGTPASRVALIHAVAHIELNAIDLAFDIVARFGHLFPRAFSDDWVRVGDDEARHFLMLDNRLAAFDSHYGALPAHDGLWQSSEATAGDVLARLAVVPMVLEARGLDVTPDMVKRLHGHEDHETARLLGIIYEDEKSHVAAGSDWFHHLCAERDLDPEATFQAKVRACFNGTLKPPFNRPARDEARLPVTFYEPLAAMLEHGI